MSENPGEEILELGGRSCPMKYKPPNRRTDTTETCLYEAGHDGPCKFPSSVVREEEVR